MAKPKLESTVRVGRFVFEYNTDCNFYECRGEVMYDDEHDQIPEPALWSEAHELKSKLEAEGYKDVEVSHSEKGWVEVNVG
jgi:hypothetical protein